MWEKKVRHNKVYYRINRRTPPCHAVATAGEHGIGEEMSQFLRLIEETIPVP